MSYGRSVGMVAFIEVLGVRGEREVEGVGAGERELEGMGAVHETGDMRWCFTFRCSAHNI
uniref:Uncharacterized protein n=1 Tax=Parascaris equorum TaxID=6256 RepID=A0A914RGY8_PAREQ